MNGDEFFKFIFHEVGQGILTVLHVHVVLEVMLPGRRVLVLDHSPHLDDSRLDSESDVLYLTHVKLLLIRVMLLNRLALCTH